MEQIPEEMYKKYMDCDIKRWKEEIDIINVEMIFYKDLLERNLKDCPDWNTIDYGSLLQSINDVEYYNQRHQRDFLAFHNQLSIMAECEDVQCESHFFDKHSELKGGIENHFSIYKQFKKNLFSHLKNTV